MQTARRCDHGKSGSLRPDVGRITCGSGVCVGMPAVLRAGRLLLDRSHLTRPISIQLWTTSFLVYDDANPATQTCSTDFTKCSWVFVGVRGCSWVFVDGVLVAVKSWAGPASHAVSRS